MITMREAEFCILWNKCTEEITPNSLSREELDELIWQHLNSPPVLQTMSLDLRRWLLFGTNDDSTKIEEP